MRLQSRLHWVLKMDDAEILAAFVQQVVDRTPGAKRGDNMTGPTALVKDGQIIQPRIFDNENVFTLPTNPSAVEVKKPEPAVCVTRRLMFDELDGHEALAVVENATEFYIHGYEARIPYRELLTTYKIGDTIPVMNDKFEPQDHVLTQKDFDEMSYFYVRYAIST